MSQRVSLTQYLVEQQRLHGHIPQQLRLLIEVVARACKRIAISVNKGVARSSGPTTDDGLKITERYKPAPGGEAHVRPRRPRPAVCSSATTHVPSAAPASASRAATSLVDVIHG